jgi:hypothetical protein
MPLTRADVESVLIARCGAALAVVGMNGTLADGTNPDLSDPIRHATRMFGISLIGTVSVTDADLATITGFGIERLIDMAERRIFETLLDRFVYVDTQVDRDSQKYDQLRKGWQARIDAITASLAKPYGPGVGGAQGGSLLRGRPVPNSATLGNRRGWPFP